MPFASSRVSLVSNRNTGFGLRSATVRKAWYSGPAADHHAPPSDKKPEDGKTTKREPWKLDLKKFEEAEKKEVEIDSRVVGLERIEALGLKDQFTGETILTGPFGTKEDPVIVQSYFNSRIVGCQGGPGDLAHELLWHEVRREKPLVCLECGQFFVLQPHPLKEKTEELMRKLHESAPADHAHKIPRPPGMPDVEALFAEEDKQFLEEVQAEMRKNGRPADDEEDDEDEKDEKEETQEKGHGHKH